MADSTPNTFHPPAEWPNAESEQALDRAFEHVRTLIETVEEQCPKGKAAQLRWREGLGHLRKAEEAFAAAYHAEMTNRVIVWRAKGYPG